MTPDHRVEGSYKKVLGGFRQNVWPSCSRKNEEKKEKGNERDARLCVMIGDWAKREAEPVKDVCEDPAYTLAGVR